MDQPVVSVDHMGLLGLDDARKRSHGSRIWRGWSMRSARLAEQPTDALGRAADPVDPHSPIDFEGGQALMAERRYRHFVAAADERKAEVLDGSFLTSQDRGVELRHHEDPHRRPPAAISW
jgi:hypothetical protein